MMLALQNNLKEGLDPALELLKADGMSQHFKQYAMLTVAKLGGKEHIPLIEPYLDDKTVCTTHTTMQGGKRTMYQTQLRDVALVAIIHLSGKDPKDFGFNRLVRGEPYLFNPGTMGFEKEENDEKDEARDAAFAKWREFQEKQQGAAPAPEQPKKETAEPEKPQETPEKPQS